MLEERCYNKESSQPIKKELISAREQYEKHLNYFFALILNNLVGNLKTNGYETIISLKIVLAAAESTMDSIKLTKGELLLIIGIITFLNGILKEYNEKSHPQYLWVDEEIRNLTKEYQKIYKTELRQKEAY